MAKAPRPSSPSIDLRRRRMLQAGLFLTLSAAAGPAAALGGPRQRRLQMVNLHTGDEVDAIYWRNGHWRESALERIDWVLRDHRADQATVMDRGLLDLMHRLHAELGVDTPYSIISGYRSPATNAMLRKASSGVAKRSLHMQGRAVDLRVEGIATAELRDAARALRAGGVGYYPRSGFVHVDTGRVRYW